jgi:hypothetical protein
VKGFAEFTVNVFAELLSLRMTGFTDRKNGFTDCFFTMGNFFCLVKKGFYAGRLFRGVYGSLFLRFHCWEIRFPKDP